VPDFINLFFQLLYQFFECLDSFVVIRMLMTVPCVGHVPSHDLRKCGSCWQSVSNLAPQGSAGILASQSVSPREFLYAFA
jgi:hypothetical protein